MATRKLKKKGVVLKKIINPNFDFSSTPLNFSDKDEGRVKSRIEKAKEILRHISNGENTALRADTGTGKTDIAFLVCLPLIFERWRILFLAPTRELVGQQNRAFQNVTEKYAFFSKEITGETKKEKRNWDDENVSIIFSTPQTVKDLDKFDLIIFDELHHATGKYDYVRLIKQANEKDKMILGLSASLGDTEEKIEKLSLDLEINRLTEFVIKMPEKTETIIEANIDAALTEIDSLFLSLFKILNKKIKKNDLLEKIPKRGVLKMKDIVLIEEKINEWDKNSKKYFEIISSIANYKKLKYAHFTCITEGYASFLEYVKKLEKDETHAGKKIINADQIKKILEIVKRNKNKHPKADLFKKYIEKNPPEKKIIIFVGEKITGKAMLRYMKNKGYRAEIIHGGRETEKMEKKQKIKKLENGEINFLIATSVIEEGIHIPRVDEIINYSVPRTSISRIQREGRTGRTKKGRITDLIINHPMDKIVYWITSKGARRAKNLKSTKSREKQLVFRF